MNAPSTAASIFSQSTKARRSLTLAQPSGVFGLRVHYKARLALKNGQTKWTVHWMTEVKQLVDRKLPEEIRHSVRGFTDRRKAFGEAAKEIRVDDDSFRRRAEAIVKKDYGLGRLREKLDPEDTAEFWSRVASAADVAFAVLRSTRSSR